MSANRERSGNRCPGCDASSVAEIIYGYPSPELVERSRDEPVALGGCEIGPDSPLWRCLECGEEWRRGRERSELHGRAPGRF